MSALTVLIACPPDDPLGLLAVVDGGTPPSLTRCGCGRWGHTGCAFLPPRPQALLLSRNGRIDPLGAARVHSVLTQTEMSEVEQALLGSGMPLDVARTLNYRAPAYRPVLVDADGAEVPSGPTLGGIARAMADSVKAGHTGPLRALVFGATPDAERWRVTKEEPPVGRSAILAVWDPSRAVILRVDDSGQFFEGEHPVRAPSHWRPLPLPPSHLLTAEGTSADPLPASASGQEGTRGRSDGCRRVGDARPPFRTEHLGRPTSPDVLAHNAYVEGWEDGAMDAYDHTRIPEGLLEHYRRGRAAGVVARSKAFACARDIKLAVEQGKAG